MHLKLHACMASRGEALCVYFVQDLAQNTWEVTPIILAPPAPENLGVGHSCVINRNRKLFCWGLNSNGQLGIGNTTQKTSPTLINSTSKFVWVSAANSHTCAIRTDGLAMCWGL